MSPKKGETLPSKLIMKGFQAAVTLELNLNAFSQQIIL
jgi:hypothetical protein